VKNNSVTSIKKHGGVVAWEGQQEKKCCKIRWLLASETSRPTKKRNQCFSWSRLGKSWQRNAKFAANTGYFRREKDRKKNKTGKNPTLQARRGWQKEHGARTAGFSFGRPGGLKPWKKGPPSLQTPREKKEIDRSRVKKTVRGGKDTVER